MKMLLVSLFFAFFWNVAEAQDFERDKYVPTIVDYPEKQEPIQYRWPHLNYVPKYVGIIGGVQGFHELAFEGGLVLNLVEFDYVPGAIVGGALMYKRSFRDEIQTYSAEFGVYLPICFGVNFNYNLQNGLSTFGVKPFIGVSVYNFQLLYGFNMYSRKSEINGLRHNHFELRYVIPIISFGKSPNKMVRTFSNYPSEDNYYRRF